MRYAFDSGDAPEWHQTQYFEMVCNRGIYHNGWSAVTKHRAPWEPLPPPALEDDVWELYGSDDWTQARNIADEQPEMLERLRGLWLLEAMRYQVLPLDDRFVERNIAELAGRPRLMRGSSQFLFGGMGRLNEWSTISIKNKSHSVTAELQVSDDGAQGVIVAQGGRFGGWSLYARDGRPIYFYNYFGVEHYTVEGNRPLPKGTHTLRVEFDYDGGGTGKGALASIFIDGDNVGHGRIERTVPIAFSIDETLDIGRETGSPVSPDYGSRDNGFRGEVNWVHIDVRGNDYDREVPAEERFKAAMAWE